MQIGLDINSLSQSQGAPRGNENTGKIEKKDGGSGTSEDAKAKEEAHEVDRNRGRGCKEKGGGRGRR